MNTENIITEIKNKIESVIMDQTAHFLVDIKIKPTNNIKVYIDGDNGVGIDELVKYNRLLYKDLEQSALFPDGDFSLEISSPGLDEPLKMHRQYVKNINRFVEVALLDGKKIEGRLSGVQENEIQVEEIKGKGKKAETLYHTVLFNNIKTTKIQIKF